jgi:hypothetical protein
MAGFVFGDLGPCEVQFGIQVLGGNLKVTPKSTTQTADIKDARFGEEPVDQVYVGEPTEIEVIMARSSLAALASIVPGAELTGNQLMFKSNVGTQLRSIADKLIIKPYRNGAASTDAKEWLTFFVTAPVFNTDLTFDASTQRQAPVTFRAFCAETVPTGETYEVGDRWAIGYGEES